MACLENVTYEEIVAHLERELELNVMEGSDGRFANRHYDLGVHQK